LISKTAGVSEGSLFTYFKTKDELITALYRELRLDFATTVMSGFPRRASVRVRLEHVWSRYIAWNVENPIARKALRHISMSKVITPEVRAESGTLFAEVERIQSDAVQQRRLKLPPAMASQALQALADMTTGLIERHPRRSRAKTPSSPRRKACSSLASWDRRANSPRLRTSMRTNACRTTYGRASFAKNLQ
jgi:AcrR family transcriptional regulator